MLALALSFAVVGLAFCYTVLRIAGMLGGKLAESVDRYLKVLEQKHAPPKGTSEAEPIPDDIVAHVLSTRHAKWAQEQEFAFAREKYNEYGQWPPVRVLMGIGNGEEPE